MSLHLVMKLSKLCNLRCNYCYEYDDLHRKERMPLDGVAYFLTQLAARYGGAANAPELHFVCHGGEPLLLPADYLRAFCRLQDDILAPAGLRYRTSLQTNLTKLDDRTLDLLLELDIGLGVSYDVFGAERVNRKGECVDDRVLGNLQRLIDTDTPFGAIVVLHAGNIDQVLPTYRFYNAIGVNYRVLPIFSRADNPARMLPLMVPDARVVTAFKRIAHEALTRPSNIRVQPIQDYLAAAVRYCRGDSVTPYRPADTGEWALIVNTNGDAYNHGDAYLREGLIGNVFDTPLDRVLAGPAYRAMDAQRMARAATCRRCPFDGYCDQLPVVESVPSERAYDGAGRLTCPLARPLIEYCIELVRHNPRAGELIALARAA